MSKTPPIVSYFILMLLAFAPVPLLANETVNNLSKENTSLSNQRITHSMWSSEKNTDFTSKRFPMTSWGKHFSSVGSKRSPIELTEGKDKKIFKTNQKEFPTKEFNLSAWNQKFADLHKDAQISTDDKARKIADRQLYNMMLQDTRQYADLGKELSLRDLNKYQFRRNRSEGAIPTTTVGN